MNDRGPNSELNVVSLSNKPRILIRTLIAIAILIRKPLQKRSSTNQGPSMIWVSKPLGSASGQRVMLAYQWGYSGHMGSICACVKYTVYIHEYLHTCVIRTSVHTSIHQLLRKRWVGKLTIMHMVDVCAYTCASLSTQLRSFGYHCCCIASLVPVGARPYSTPYTLDRTYKPFTIYASVRKPRW